MYDIVLWCIILYCISLYCIYVQLDGDENGLISIQEFVEYTQNKLFDNKEEWQPVVDKEPFTDEEFADYEEEYEDYYDYEYDAEGNIIGISTK